MILTKRKVGENENTANFYHLESENSFPMRFLCDMEPLKK